MPNTYLYCLSNSGLYLYRQGTGLLIDGLYGRGPYQCFSPFPEALHRQMLSGEGLFAHLGGLVFTHTHGDHCDGDLLYYLRHARPELSVYGYGLEGNTPAGRTLAQGIRKLRIGPFSITALDAVHEQAGGGCDKTLFDLPNCMLLLETGAERILLTADAILGRREAELVRRFGNLDLVFCNPMQLATDEKCEFFQRISMKRLLLTHLPAPEDDRYCYWSLARQECRNRVFGAVRPELARQMSWLDGVAPEWARIGAE
ncbi:MAG: hypothetical protein AB7E30_04675 [Lawsonibacter sp.]